MRIVLTGEIRCPECGEVVREWTAEGTGGNADDAAVLARDAYELAVAAAGDAHSCPPPVPEHRRLTPAKLVAFEGRVRKLLAKDQDRPSPIFRMLKGGR